MSDERESASPGHSVCVGGGKAHTVVVRPGGGEEVIKWQLGDHRVPAVHTVGATVVRFPVMYYVHADYGPEVMAIRTENIARLGWSSESFNLPLVPKVVGRFNLLSRAVAAVGKELQGSPTKSRVEHPTTIGLRSVDDWRDQFRIYLNLPGYEFYHLLFVVGPEHGPGSRFAAERADVGSVPKLLAWLRKFETAKRKLYRDNGLDWNPKRGPIGTPRPTTRREPLEANP